MGITTIAMLVLLGRALMIAFAFAFVGHIVYTFSEMIKSYRSV